MISKGLSIANAFNLNRGLGMGLRWSFCRGLFSFYVGDQINAPSPEKFACRRYTVSISGLHTQSNTAKITFYSDCRQNMQVIALIIDLKLRLFHRVDSPMSWNYGLNRSVFIKRHSINTYFPKTFIFRKRPD